MSTEHVDNGENKAYCLHIINGGIKMTDQQKIDALRDALAALLRQSANPDPIHPAYKDAVKKAADIYQATQ